MTTIDLIGAARTLQSEITAAKIATLKDKKNPAWLAVAEGALATALGELGNHLKNNDKLNPDGSPIPEPEKK